MASSSWTLSEQITAHLRRSRLGDARTPSLWPSEASAVLTNAYGEPSTTGACRRSTFLRYVKDQVAFDKTKNSQYVELADELHKLETPPDKYMQWIWIAGGLFEDFVIEQAKQSGVYAADQVQVVIPEASLVGKLDLLVINPETGGYIAEEIKSIYGHNSKDILGTPGMINKHQAGQPRDSNLMQIALYDWHLRRRMNGLEVSRLFYGARDTGRFGEFDVVTELDTKTGQTFIRYQMVSPYRGPSVVSAITIDNVLAQYRYILDHYERTVIPPRDYELSYSQERIQLMYERGELGKGDSERQEKILARVEENKTLEATGGKPKKELLPVEKGDFYCTNCKFNKFCYNQDGSVRT